MLNHPSFKMFNEFLATSRAKDLPVDCICYIYNLLKNEITKKRVYKDKQCVMCGRGDLTHHEYLDGVGYICTTCLF